MTPNLNQGRYLERAIVSVLEQEYPNLEYIIIDGNSSDNSVEIIRKYENHLAAWVSEQDRGQSNAINKGFSLASGDLLAWLNADDFFAPGTLQLVAEVAKANAAAGAILGSGDMIDEAGELVHFSSAPDSVSQEMLFRWTNDYFFQPSCFFTGEAWVKCGPLDENLKFAMDLDLWLKIIKEFPFQTVKSHLSTSLKHSKAKTTEYAYLSVMEAAMVIARHGGMKTALTDLEGYAIYLAERELLSTQQLQLILNSKSWRFTAPLRFLSHYIKRLLP